MIHRIEPSIPVYTPKGEGLAIFLLEYGLEHDLYWVVFLNDSGECWTYSNREIRATKNITLGRINMEDVNENII